VKRILTLAYAAIHRTVGPLLPPRIYISGTRPRILAALLREQSSVSVSWVMPSTGTVDHREYSTETTHLKALVFKNGTCHQKSVVLQPQPLLQPPPPRWR